MRFKYKFPSIWFIPTLMCILVLTSCTSLPDIESAQAYKDDQIIRLNPGITAGQTFIPQHTNLDGITIWLEPQEPGLPLAFSLYRSLSDPIPIYTTIIKTVSGKNIIEFPPQPAPLGSSYYFELESMQGEIMVMGRDEDAYSNGSAILEGVPIDSDLAFLASYDYDIRAVLEDITTLVKHSWLSIPLILLLFIPGWLLIDLSGLSAKLDPWEKSAVSIGLSVATIPVLMLWSTVVGLVWNQRLVRITAGLLGLFTLWRVGSSLRRKHKELGSIFKTNKHLLESLIMPSILLITILVRFAMVRDLDVPAWVDSIHHSLISNQIIQAGGFPENFLPHIPVNAASYHPGFHSLVAVFHWLTDLPVPQCMLILGQVMNIAMVLGSYLLTTTLLKDKKAGWVAALITGTLSLMPAYYAGWGRYTQLAGLLLLPVSYLWTSPERFHDIKSPQKTIWQYGLGALSFAGLFLIHYRVLFFVLCLILASWIGIVYHRNSNALKNLAVSPQRETLLKEKESPIADPTRLSLRLSPQHKVLLKEQESPRPVPVRLSLRTERSAVRQSPSTLATFFVQSIKRTTLMGLIGILIVLPWLLPVMVEIAIPFANQVDVSYEPPPEITWRYITPIFGIPIMILAGIGMVLGLYRRQRFSITILLWILLLFGLANPGYFRLPFPDEFINQSSVEIMLFIPLSILGGYLVSRVYTVVDHIKQRYIKRIWQISFIVFGMVAAILGSQKLISSLNPETILYRDSDTEGIAWLSENIPKDETIVINPAGWGYGIYRGADGGYWISPLTGLKTIPPNVLYGLDSENWEKINDLSVELIQAGKNPDQIKALMLEHHLNYIYIGGRGGVISPHALAHHPGFKTLYNVGDVWIFKSTE